MFVLAMSILSATPDASFLTEFAQTRRYLAGRPERAKIAPDGKAVWFLRSAPKDSRQTLFEFDVASGKTKELLNPETLLHGAAETLSVEEKARLERMRVSARGFTSYSVSEDGRRLLVTLSGKLYVYERASGKTTKLETPEGACLDPKFSPDGSMVAYVREHDVRVVPLATNVERAVTTGGTQEQTNGLAEFVAQEEMSRFSGFWFSPDSKQVLVQHSDLRGVERFGIADPMHPEAEAERFHYPRPGKKNAVVSLSIVSLAGGAPVNVTWDAAAFPYLATARWPKAGKLTLVVQNREQTKALVLAVDPKTGATSTLLTEEDAAWLNLNQDFPRWLGDGSGFFWSSERSGAPEVELRNADGSLKAVWVKGALGFKGENGLAGWSEATKTLYVLGSANPTETLLWKVVDGGAPVRVPTASKGSATETATSNDDASLFVVSSTSLSSMVRTHVVKADGTVVAELPSVAIEPSLPLNAQLLQLDDEPKSWAMVLRPRDFVKAKKYPVILSVYGGPGHQEVVQSLRENLILQWLANQGFIVAKLDGRGTPRRGRAWERAISHDFATITSGDQVTGLKALGRVVPEMDLARVGLYGWSFGGYLSALLALSKPEAVKYAVAGAPVVDWLDYDTHYTERYLGVPTTSTKPYETSSLLTYVNDAKRPLLLLHGTADDNVYFLHTLKLSDALFKAGKPHEVLPLTNFTHMVPDPLVTQRLWERIARAFKENL